jgi:predicted nucleic acid-binding protein
VTAYIDTSALLRIVLREPGALDELRSSYDALVSSELIAVESARTIDRLRLQGSLTANEAAARVRAINEWLEAIDLVLLRPPILSRASEPMPMALGSLDAIHLATALIWRDRIGPLSMMATHDTALGSAARAFGFDVRGS